MTRCILFEWRKWPKATQTLCAGCSKAEPKNVCPAADPLPGGARRPKFNQLEMVTTFTYRPSLVKIDACNFDIYIYMVTDPQTNKQTHKQIGPITIHCAAKLRAQCKWTIFQWFMYCTWFPETHQDKIQELFSKTFAPVFSRTYIDVFRSCKELVTWTKLITDPSK